MLELQLHTLLDCTCYSVMSLLLCSLTVFFCIHRMSISPSLHFWTVSSYVITNLQVFKLYHNHLACAQIKRGLAKALKLWVYIVQVIYRLLGLLLVITSWWDTFSVWRLFIKLTTIALDCPVTAEPIWGLVVTGKD